MSHYDRRNAALGPGVFTLADARGNNPHGTTESADAEGKRRNAGRYETVAQLDRAIDSRARMPPLGYPGAPSVTAPNPDGLLGLLVVCGLVAAATYVFATRARTNGGDDEDDVAPPVDPPLALPAAPPTPQPIVITTPAPAVITNPAPVVIDVVAEPTRRRRSKKTVVAPAVVTVTQPR